jgi:hypothetical protein
MEKHGRDEAGRCRRIASVCWRMPPVYSLRDEDARVEIDVIGRQGDTGRACCAGQCG